MDGHPVDRDSLREQIQDAPHHHGRRVLALQLGEEEPELVGRDAGDHVGFPQASRQGAREAPENADADVLAVLVDELPEEVEAEDRHGEPLLVATRPRELLLQALDESRAVGKPRHRIAQHEGDEARFPLSLARDVPHEEDDLGVAAPDHPRLQVANPPAAGELELGGVQPTRREGPLDEFQDLPGDLGGNDLVEPLPEVAFVSRAANPALLDLGLEDDAVARDPEDEIGDGLQEGPRTPARAVRLVESHPGPDEVADAEAEDVPVDRLRGEIGGPDLERAPDRLHVVEAGHHEDRRAPPRGQRADRGTGREAVHHGHHGVHQDEGRSQPLEGRHALPAVPGLLHVEAGALEGRPGDEAGNHVVVHEQDERTTSRMADAVHLEVLLRGQPASGSAWRRTQLRPSLFAR